MMFRMPTCIELYGVPRQRAGIDRLQVEAATLREALQAAVSLHPGLADCCTREGRLRPGYIANLNGRTFVRDDDTPLSAGDAVLLLSADAGG